MSRDAKTLEVSEEMAALIAELARQRQCSPEDVVEIAVKALAAQQPTDAESFEQVRRRLSGPLQALAEFLAEHSISDEWRTF